MIHWTDLTDGQLEQRIASVLGPWYWPSAAEVWGLVRNRDTEPSWTIIDTILNGEMAVAA